MGVDFILQRMKTKPDRMKQEEFLIILLEKVMKYTFRYVLCNSAIRFIGKVVWT